MKLTAGTRLGPYEIVAPIGAGGMGEVYRANDTRLGRAVAVKVLPEAVAADADRIARFQHEARAAGQLAHPGILAIHDIGVHDGSPYIVSELLEGETLESRLSSGALPPRRAIDLALQLAQGLGAAHEKGIIHRDLKPENLFLTRDGRLKILDFGLAKLSAAEAGSSGVAPTQPGAILGTVGYMAPEQVRGAPADNRSDLFSFGVILYEMLTGKRAFDGPSPVEAMNAILKEEPPAIETNPGLDRLIKHCLEKKPEDRYQSARDLAFDLGSLVEPTSVSFTQRGAPSVKPGRRWRAPVWAIVAPLVIAAAAGGFVVGKGAPRVEPAWKQLTFRHGILRNARFAPDGQTIVYGAAWGAEPNEIYTTRREATESRALGIHGDLLAISSQGEMALLIDRDVRGVLVTAVGTLARAPLAGGSPRPVADGVHEADFAPDGELAAVREIAGQYAIEWPLGKTVLKRSGWVSHFRISPRGDAAAFIDHPIIGDDRGRVMLIDRQGTVTPVTREWMSAQGVAWRGDEIWYTATESGMTRAMRATDRAGHERLIARGPYGLTIQDIASDGRALVTRDVVRGELIMNGPGGARERDLAWFDSSAASDLSPDGKKLLIVEGGEGGGTEYGVYLRDTLSGKPPVRLTDGRASGLSPDGKWIVTIPHADRDQLGLLPTGPGQGRRITSDALNHSSARFSTDGKQIVFQGSEDGHAQRLFVMSVEGGPPRAISPEGIAADRFVVGPNGEVAALTADRTPTIFFFDGRPPQPIRGLTRGEVPLRFTSDGKKLYFITKLAVPAQVYLLDRESATRSLWKEISPADPAGVPDVATILITPDGDAWLYSVGRLLDDLFLVEGLK
jgi:hypothetical protein